MSTSITVTLNRTENKIKVEKDGEIIDGIDADKHIPSDCTRITCECKTLIESFFRGMILRYRSAYGKSTRLIDKGDVVMLIPA